ncbi:MAG: sulfatase, partial [Armatimonadota bacterium]
MSERTQEPNFLLVVTDQQRTDTLGAYGCELGATPHIDAMAAAGVTFPRGYCNNPLCMPSRAALLTGRYPSSTGVRTNGCTAHPGQPLLAELLAQAGYRTGAFGKVHFHPGGGEPGGYWPENRTFIESGADLTQPYLGFQTVAVGCGHGEVLPGLHAAELAEHHPDVYAKRGRDNALVVPDPWLFGAQKIETYQTAIPPEHYATTWVTDKTIDFIQSAEEPFFAWCGIPDPHHPFKPPGDYWHKFDPADMPPATCREGELDDKPPHFRSFWEGEYAGLDTDGFLLGSKGQLTDERLRI